MKAGRSRAKESRRRVDDLPTEPVARRARWQTMGRVLVVVLAGFAIYAPVLGGGWLWDDGPEIVENALLRDPMGWWKAWVGPVSADYWPLKVTFQWMLWRMLGADPAGYHAISLLLHVASGLLAWRVFWQLGMRLAWMGGLLFVVHPVAVESVAWVAEMKNTLSLPPLLVALSAWIEFDRSGRRRDWVLAFAGFIAAMLCKSSVVMAPAVLLLYAWWRRGRVGWRDLRMTAPFFAVSIVLGLVTIGFQHERAIGGWDIDVGGPMARVANAGLIAVFYAWKTILPLGLTAVYPRWRIEPLHIWQFWPWLVFAAVVWWAWRDRRGWGRHAFLGGGFFLLNLVPVCGLISMAWMRYTWVADHFAYVSIIGIAGLVTAGVDALALRFVVRARMVMMATGAAVVCLLAVRASLHARVFRDQESLWTHTAASNPEAWVAFGNLGSLRLAQGRLPEAIEALERALQIKPDYTSALYNLGNVLAASGRPADAMARFEETIRLEPRALDARVNLANLFAQAGRSVEALAQLDAAHELDPNAIDPLVNRAQVFLGLGRVDEAVSSLEVARSLEPENADVLVRLAEILVRMGRRADAERCYRDALHAKPGHAEAHLGLGNLLASSGRMSEAVVEYRAAVRAQPDLAAAHANLGNALLMLGRVSDAISAYEAALRLRPGDRGIRANLEQARALARQGGGGS